MPNTHFRIASNTKTMTSALIVLLAQDGKLKFGDPVSAYVPDVPNGENITIAELLKMRSGLYNYTADPELATALDADPTKVWTPQEVLSIAFRHPPKFAPGTAYAYNNTNYALLGLVAEKAGGRPLAQQFHDRLFSPLGLQQTSLPALDDTVDARLPTRTATCTAGRSTRSVDEPYPAEIQAAAQAGTLQAHRLHQPELVVRLRCRRSHLHRGRPGHVDHRRWCQARCSTPTTNSSG